MLTRTWLLAFGVLLTLTVAAPWCAGDEPPAPGWELLAQAGKMKFEVYQDAAKEYRWRLKAANGQILATAGEGYKAKADGQKAVERIKAGLGDGKLMFEVYEDKAKEFRWRLKAPNGQIVGASSEGYKAKADCERAIDLIKKDAPKADVDDKT